MAAKLSSLSKTNKKLSNSLKGKGNSDQEDSTSRDSKTNSKRKGNRPAWMFNAPTDGSTTMYKNGKHYNWCPTHKAWGKHTPEACELKKKLEGQTANSDTSDQSSVGNDDNDDIQMEINHNLTAIMEDDEGADF